jgi:hypothetical protein
MTTDQLLDSFADFLARDEASTRSYAHLTRIEALKVFTDNLSQSDSAKLYIAVLDEFPDFMTPTLVAPCRLVGSYYAPGKSGL